jgi:hypothetical protein
MKTRQHENILKLARRKSFGLRARRHDPMLVFNLALFNFTDGWNRTLAKYQYARFYA